MSTDPGDNQPRIDTVSVTMERVGTCPACEKRVSRVKTFKAPTLELATDAGYAWREPLFHPKCKERP